MTPEEMQNLADRHYSVNRISAPVRHDLAELDKDLKHLFSEELSQEWFTHSVRTAYERLNFRFSLWVAFKKGTVNIIRKENDPFTYVFDSSGVLNLYWAFCPYCDDYFPICAIDKVKCPKCLLEAPTTDNAIDPVSSPNIIGGTLKRSPGWGESKPGVWSTLKDCRVDPDDMMEKRK